MLGRNRVERDTAPRTVRVVEVLDVEHTVARHQRRCALEMVAQHIEDAVVRRVAAAAQPAAFVVAGVSRALPLVDTGDIDGRGSTDSSLDAVAVGVVQERRQRRRSLLHLGQAVFVVEGEGIGDTADGPAGLVAVAVVAVRVAIGARHGVFVAAVAVGIRIAGVAGQVADRIVDVGVVQAEGAAVVSDHLSCGTPQTCTVPSASPHANKLPSGLQATAVTG